MKDTRLFSEHAFIIRMTGLGDTRDEAWADAVEHFTLDPGSTPEPEPLLVAAPEMYEFVKHITEKWENMPLAPDKLYGKKMMVKSSSFAALLMQDTEHKARALLAKIEGE